MGVYSLSNAAEADFENLYEYGILTFGIEQARQYALLLKDGMQTLADNVKLGRTAYEFAPGLRRLTCGSHILFYLPISNGILVVRILHQSMNFKRHGF